MAASSNSDSSDIVILEASPEPTANSKQSDGINTSQKTSEPTPAYSSNGGPVEDSDHREPWFCFGPYVPILRKDTGVFIDPAGIVNCPSRTSQGALKKRLFCEVLPDDGIIEAPSLVTPLLLKKKTKWPPRVIKPRDTGSKTANSAATNADTISDPSDDIQVVKVVNKTAPSKLDSNSRNVDDYINATAVASLTNTKNKDNNAILAIDDYYKSSVGELLLGIGLSRVSEIYLEENARRLASKMRKCGEKYGHLIGELESTRSRLSRTKASNKPYRSSQLLKCPHCPFKSDLSIVMDGHLEVPHTNSRKEYLCNWCKYKVRDFDQMIYHNLTEHRKRCRLERPPALHNCRFCSFECRSKRKIVAHITKCEQVFPHSLLLCPEDFEECDYPAITSKTITREDVKSYEQALKTLRLAAYNPHQLKVPNQVRGFTQQPIIVVQRHNASSSNPEPTPVNHGIVTVPVGSNPLVSSLGPVGNKAQVLTNPTHCAQLLHLLSSQDANVGPSKTNSLQHPLTQSSFMNGKSVIKTASNLIMGPNQSLQALSDVTTQPVVASNSDKDLMKNNSDRMVDRSHMRSSGASNYGATQNPKSSTFVICEICDGYIKDLGQLKSHMQWTHKVKIHQKMLESRPPLSCQKCQWRFFTDQGLERHLLGAHGLVTSNMQELVDQGSDSGRCTICGRAYASKIVSHMRDVHRSNLKPAHLSYKCTVCSATFNLYMLFENHVYSVHSESVRRTVA